MPTRRTVPSSLVVAAACLLWPAAATARACAGMPLEWSPTGVAVDWVRGNRLALYEVRMGRDLGGDLFVVGGYSHVRYQRDSDFGPIGDGPTGNGVAATFAYRMPQSELPFCLLTTVRYGRSTHRYTQPGWSGGNPDVEVRNSSDGGTLLGGVGAGHDILIGSAAALIPFATARLGWSERRIRQSCSGECHGYSGSEGILQLEGETGLMLQLGRFHLGGSFRMMTSEADPLLYAAARYGEEVSLFAVRVGVVL
jgi:hypothetical protein